jgi:hypothetical protein
MNPFDFINSISYNKEYLIGVKCEEKDYNPYLVNRGLSYFPDTIHYANMMNKNSHIDKLLQYDFLLNIISKKKRYGKWNKKEITDDVELVSQYYTISAKEAEQYLPLLTQEQLDIIKLRLSKGGRDNERKGK